MTARAARTLVTSGPVLGVLAVGLIVRAVLVPITHGADFTVWDLASRATLGGVNVYAHHPAYSGGPYSYFPLFLYIELPMQWLAMHTGVSFTILGKLPIVAADVAATVLIVVELAHRGQGERAAAVGAALFFLNPLVLYNGAFYGRFDSVAVALLMLAVGARRVGGHPGWRSTVAFALAVAAKTYPIFLLPWLIRSEQRTAARVLCTVAAVLLVVSAPYVITSPGALVTDLLYSADKLPGGLSWQVVLHGLPATVQVDIGDVLLGAFAVVAVILAAADDVAVVGAAVLVVFLLLSKQVIEQYLLWPLPFLVLLAVGARAHAAWWLLGELTLAGMLVNAHFHPFGVQPAAFNVVLAIAVSLALGRLLATERQRRAPRGEAATAPPLTAGSNLVVGSDR